MNKSHLVKLTVSASVFLGLLCIPGKVLATAPLVDGHVYLRDGNGNVSTYLGDTYWVQQRDSVGHTRYTEADKFTGRFIFPSWQSMRDINGRQLKHDEWCYWPKWPNYGVGNPTFIDHDKNAGTPGVYKCQLPDGSYFHNWNVHSEAEGFGCIEAPLLFTAIMPGCSCSTYSWDHFDNLGGPGPHIDIYCDCAAQFPPSCNIPPINTSPNQEVIIPTSVSDPNWHDTVSIKWSLSPYNDSRMNGSLVFAGSTTPRETPYTDTTQKFKANSYVGTDRITATVTDSTNKTSTCSALIQVVEGPATASISAAFPESLDLLKDDTGVVEIGQYIAQANKPANNSLDSMVVWYRRIKDSSGNAVKDTWHLLDNISCPAGVSECIKTIRWQPANNSDEGSYELRVDAHNKGTASWCTGDPACEASFGSICYDYSQNESVFDCDPYHTVPNDKDILGVTIRTRTSCGDGIVQAPNDFGQNEVCDLGKKNTDSCEWSSNQAGAKKCCHTKVHANACQWYTGPYCGDGEVNDIQEECETNQPNCDSDCKKMKKSWFKTLFGDFYSDYGINEELPNGQNFSSYLCMKNDNAGQFYFAGGGCSGQIDSYWIRVESGILTQIRDEAVGIYDSLPDVDPNMFLNSWPSGKVNISNIKIFHATNDLVIEEDVRRTSKDAKDCALLIIADKNVIVGENVTNIDAFIITRGKFVVRKSSKPFNLSGGVVAVADNNVNVSGVEVNRDTYSVNYNESPSELFQYDARYIEAFRDIFGKVESSTFGESGVD